MRNSTAEIYDDSYKAYSSTGIVHDTPFGWEAFRGTPHGYVSMEARAWQNGEGTTWLHFNWQGRQYRRTFARYYGARWAARLAEEFVCDVVEGRFG